MKEDKRSKPMKEDKLSNTATDLTVAVIIFVTAAAFLGVYLGDVVGLYTRFLDLFSSSGWQEFKRVAFVIFGILDAVLLVFIIYVLRRHLKLDKLTQMEKTPVEVAPEIASPASEVSENWDRIRELANSSSVSDWNMALIRADALLDDVLVHLGYQEGETLSERLKTVDPTKLKSMDRLLAARRLRNAIVHDPLVEHTKENIIYALRSYQEALKELGVLNNV